MTILFVIVSIYSCEKEGIYDDTVTKGKKATKVDIESKSSDAGVDPVIIESANLGGNITCSEVANYFNLDPNPFFCGDKVDYNNGFPADAFPEGLEVTVTEETYVSFEMDDCIPMGDKHYKVGAVIVKGSNEANVYYYGTEGTYGDSNLHPPVNASGKPAGLSNLTFCFIECETEDDEEELILAMKTYILPEGGDPEKDRAWAVTHGEGSDEDALNIGYKSIDDNDIKLYLRYSDNVVAYMTVTKNTDAENKKFLKIDIVFDEAYEGWTFEKSYLYVGSVEDFKEYIVGPDRSGNDVTDYEEFPYIEDESLSSRTFEIYYE